MNFFSTAVWLHRMDAFEGTSIEAIGLRLELTRTVFRSLPTIQNSPLAMCPIRHGCALSSLLVNFLFDTFTGGELGLTHHRGGIPSSNLSPPQSNRR